MSYAPEEDEVRATDVPALLADFARSLRDARHSASRTLDEILRTAIELIEGAVSGCITTLTNGERTVVASTDELAETLCRRQYELGEGPIPTEVRHFDVVVAEDLGVEKRWPQFASKAVDQGFRSLAAFKLFTNGDDVGALVLYSSNAGAFDVEALATGEALAAHAAVALLGLRDGNQFRAGLASRDIIGQAKGMIMERYKIDSAQAFDLLTKLSQEQNLPLRRIAQDLVEASHPAG
ncbi:GAF and ANTAR domain-containing protein [Rhodococcoides yunnanense]|uniref:GAF and ANTAR domain-containing protein n=1 Tax=Rhodococcoides yunnanense TaxID=278209 RepID=UPI000933302E|nr:GAF and ANTAR domain-containing protein [Rhodococcus yunnanensis]